MEQNKHHHFPTFTCCFHSTYFFCIFLVIITTKVVLKKIQTNISEAVWLQLINPVYHNFPNCCNLCKCKMWYFSRKSSVYHVILTAMFSIIRKVTLSPICQKIPTKNINWVNISLNRTSTYTGKNTIQKKHFDAIDVVSDDSV